MLCGSVEVKMNDLIIEKTKSTPNIFFSQTSNLLSIKGESFPENSAKFYAPVLEWMKEYFSSLENETPSVIDFEVIYFNSSTSKIYMTIFDMLEENVKNGKTITVNWICDKENETAIECGEEFQEDLTCLPFNIVMK
jgi:hypothetical protein